MITRRLAVLVAALATGHPLKAPAMPTNGGTSDALDAPASDALLPDAISARSAMLQNDRGLVKSGGVRAELFRLLVEDSRNLGRPERGEAAEPAGPIAPEATLVMSPYIVREQRAFEPLVLTPDVPLLAVLRDGTLFHGVGKTVTTTIRLHFYTTETLDAGNIAPRNGVEVGYFVSW